MGVSSMMSSYRLTPSPAQESLEDRLRAMVALEGTGGYKTKDYLQAWKVQQPGNETAPSSSPTTTSDSWNLPLLEKWRLIMAEWAFHFVDHFEYPRDAVGVCMNFIDRYMQDLATSLRTPPTKREFQLVSATCLYLSLKASCPQCSCPSAKHMSFLCRNLFTEEEIVAKELDVLQKLQWRLRPPTSHAFLNFISAHLQARNATELPRSHWERVVEKAEFVVEVALLDFALALHRPSHVAAASLFNALEDTLQYLPSHRARLQEKIAQVLMHTEDDRISVRCCQLHLRSLHGDHEPLDLDAEATDASLGRSSPVCITHDFKF